MLKFVVALAALFALPLTVNAATVASKKAPVSIARVTHVVPVAMHADNIQVSVAVQDLGGSTDVSPTQKVYLTIYLKGEMNDIEATFLISDVLDFKSARSTSPTTFEVVASHYDGGPNPVFDRTFTIDASTALTALKAVKCNDFDCKAAQKFSSTVEVTYDK